MWTSADSSQRRQSSSVASPAMSSRSVERPFTPRPTRSHSASTKPISRASSSDGSQKETGVEATPRAITRVRTGPLNSPSDITSRGKERSKSRAKPGKPRPKGTARHDNLRARFANIMKTQDSPLPRRSRQGSNRSSQYVTTSESDDGVANGSRPRRLGIRAEDSPPSYGGVRATPLIKRLRPRNRGASFTSQASTEVDADAEDNGEDNEDEHESAPSSSRKGSLSTRPERRAKKAAIEALRQGDDDEMSIDDAASELDGGASE